MLHETRKIMGLPELRLSATCVRVPVLRAHSEAVNIEFDQPFPVEEARALLAAAPGVELIEDFDTNRFPMPTDVTGRDPVAVGRIRQDRSDTECPGALALWRPDPQGSGSQRHPDRRTADPWRCSLTEAPAARAPFGRVLTAMVTPFSADGGVDLELAGRLATHLVSQGSDGLVICGTTGESPTLSWDEEHQLFSAVKAAVGSRASLVAGCGSNCTSEAVEAIRKAAQLGADGALVVVPYYNKPPQERSGGPFPRGGRRQLRNCP